MQTRQLSLDEVIIPGKMQTRQLSLDDIIPGKMQTRQLSLDDIIPEKGTIVPKMGTVKKTAIAVKSTAKMFDPEKKICHGIPMRKVELSPGRYAWRCDKCQTLMVQAK